MAIILTWHNVLVQFVAPVLIVIMAISFGRYMHTRALELREYFEAEQRRRDYSENRWDETARIRADYVVERQRLYLLRCLRFKELQDACKDVVGCEAVQKSITSDGVESFLGNCYICGGEAESMVVCMACMPKIKGSHEEFAAWKECYVSKQACVECRQRWLSKHTSCPMCREEDWPAWNFLPAFSEIVQFVFYTDF